MIRSSDKQCIGHGCSISPTWMRCCAWHMLPNKHRQLRSQPRRLRHHAAHYSGCYYDRRAEAGNVLSLVWEQGRYVSTLISCKPIMPRQVGVSRASILGAPASVVVAACFMRYVRHLRCHVCSGTFPSLRRCFIRVSACNALAARHGPSGTQLLICCDRFPSRLE